VGRLRGHVTIAHDALLPRLRGFAPLSTAIITGETETGVSYLRAGNGVVNGDILWQDSVSIEPHDTVSSLTDKLLPLYERGADLYFSGSLLNGSRQDESQATYSIWRDEADLRIDWSLDSQTIERTIRALGSPYLGARTTLFGETIVIQRGTVIPDVKFAIRQPGKVWLIDEGRPVVVCGQGLLRIDEAMQGKTSLLPLKTLRVRFQ
jgi:methionyl-tRNA formyltransferase